MNWELFDHRLEDPTAAAFRLLAVLLDEELWVAQPRMEAELPFMDETMLRQCARRLQIKNLQAERTVTPEEVDARHKIQALLHLVEEELTRRAQAIPTAELPSEDKFATYQVLQEAYSRIQESYSPAHAADCLGQWKELLPKVTALRTQAPVEYLQEDLNESCCSVLEQIGDCYVALDDPQKALAYYSRSIEEAEASQLTPQAVACGDKLLALLFSRTGEFDRALAELLSRWKNLSGQPPSMARVILSRLLAEAYSKIGDRFESEKMLKEVEKDLQNLGYPLPDPGNLYVSLASWIVTTDSCTRGANNFRWQLYKVTETFLSLAHIRSNISATPAQGEAALALFRALYEVFQEMSARDQEIFVRDQRYLDEGFAEMPDFQHRGDNIPSEAPGIAFGQQAKHLGEAIVALRERVEAGDQSGPLLDEAMALEERARALGEVAFAGAALDMQADLLQQMGQWEDAVKAWRLAHTEAVAAGRLDYALYLLEKMMEPFLDQKDHARISDICGEAISLIERNRDRLSPGYQQSAFLQQKIRFYQLGVFTAFKLELYELMLQRMELSKAQASLRALQSHREVAGELDADSLEKEMRKLQKELEQAESEQVDGEAAILLRQKRRMVYDLLAIRRAEDQHKPVLPSFSLEAVQQLLEQDEVVFYYYWLDAGVLLVVALDREQVKVTRQIWKEEDYRGLVKWVENLGGMETLNMKEKELNAFASYLLPEELRSVSEGKKRVLFSPNRLLHIFPFHLLNCKGDFLIAHFAVSYIPNLSSLLLPWDGRDAKGVLAVGAAQFAVPGINLQPLPGAAGELEDLQRLYDQRGTPLSVLLNEAASVQRLRSWAEDGRLASFRILHFATHGEDVLTQSENPMETRLFFQNGVLDGLEIAGWRLHADLVILSACHSGRRAFKERDNEGELAGDEMFGLHAAFFSAGARCVVGALWPAADTATRVIMAAFHEHLAEMRPEFALQAAMLDYLRKAEGAESTGVDSERSLRFIQQKTITSPANPAFWAPFFISVVGREVGE